MTRSHRWLRFAAIKPSTRNILVRAYKDPIALESLPRTELELHTMHGFYTGDAVAVNYSCCLMDDHLTGKKGTFVAWVGVHEKELPIWL